MPDLSVTQLCDLGECQGSPYTIDESFKFQNKVYTREDAILLQRAGFARTQVFSSAAMPGSFEESTQAQPRIARVWTNIKAGMQQPLFADSYEATWKGELDGRLANRCDFTPVATKRIIEVDRVICTKKVFLEDKICPSEVIETWKQDMLLAGALREQQDDSFFLNDLVVEAFIEANHINIDRHAWRGDYGSADNEIKHVDGFIKIAVGAMAASQGQILQLVFSGSLGAGEAIMGYAGGMQYSVEWNTDLATTLGDLGQFLDSLYRPVLGTKVFASVAVSAGTTVTITAHDGEIVNLNCVFGVAADGFTQCGDGSVTAATAATGDLAVASTVTQEAVTARSPIGINIVPINANNVIDRFEAWWNKVNDVDAKQLLPDFGGYLMVAPNVYNAYRQARNNHSVRVNGGCGDIDECLEYNGIRLLRINYMPPHFFMHARWQDLHVATDLVSDVSNVEVFRKQECGNIYYKGALSIGFQISRVDHISGTLCDPTNTYFNFEADMSCNIRRDRTVVPTVYVPS